MPFSERLSFISASRPISVLLWKSSIVAGLFVSQPLHAAPASISGMFIGNAYTVTAQAVAGPLAAELAAASAEACPCQGTNGGRHYHRATSIQAPGVLQAGAGLTTAMGTKTADTAVTTQTSRLEGINLLGGLITANSIRAVATMSVDATSLTPAYAGSAFANLVIAGQKIKANVAENTTIPLAGIGTVTVKAVTRYPNGNQSSMIEVEMLRIEVGQVNNLGLSVGAVITVGEALAGYDRAQPKSMLGGSASSLGVSAGAGALLNTAVASGAASGITNCTGTGGTTLTQSVSNVAIPGILSLGAAQTTAYGLEAANGSVAKTTSNVANVSLLGGLITADTITAAAQETRASGIMTPSTEGSTFGNLKVLGLAIASNVAPNTTIALPLIGSVILNEQPAPTRGFVQVNGLHIVLAPGNSLGLPAGVQLYVAHADATAKPF